MIRALALLAALLFAQPAQADAFSEAVAGLSAGGFGEKIKAVETLAALGDARAVPILRAMAEGRLLARPDGALVIDGHDATTGQPAEAEGALAVSINNRLRSAIQGAVGRLGLVSPDPAERGRAAQAVLDSPSPESAAMLRKAIERETDAAVMTAMRFSLAALDLGDADPARRLAGVAALADSSLDPQVRGLLTRLAQSDSDAGVAGAARQALEGAETRLRALRIAENLFQGISLGSVLLLAAIGLAVTFGVMGVINMAHGEMIMLGAYTTFAVQEAFRAWAPAWALDFYLVAALPAAFLVSAAIGIALERGVIRFLYGRPLETLLATWGVSLMLQQLVRSLFGATNKEVANPSWMTGGIELAGGVMLTWNRVVIVLFAVAVLAGLAALMRWSFFGLGMRAVTQNRAMASAMGIPAGRVDALTFGLGSGIAGIAGVALSQIGNVSPNLGQGYIVDSFMVVVFGGVGSLWGTLVASLSLGVVNKFLEPYAGAMLGKILVLVFIILFIQKRPRGLFALRGRSAEA
ncbi:MAG: urea ABC transporter permease subunit UrtB [Alphaproteobacteria bacterium]|nr:urea ABC transporter permease subunit UrtB [Alphaproteobacteria bacterium]